MGEGIKSGRESGGAQGRQALLGVVMIAAFGCGSGQKGSCMHHEWRGTCDLMDVKKVAQVEFPVPHVVYEAVYHPKPNPDNPRYSPPDGHLQFKVAARYEVDLREHLKAQPQASCDFHPAASGVCGDGELSVDIPEFDPAEADAKEAARKPKGCEQLETDPETAAGSQTLEERFVFPAQSAELTAELQAAVERAAQHLKNATELQCVGIVAGIATDEKVELAGQRGRALKKALVAAGVESHRLSVLAILPNYNRGRERMAPTDEDRTTVFKVLLSD